ncbi:NAD(P)/FAD-dependent oxidoreductase [Rhodococcus opacus]|uniref:NAD(P)/FAD-dependent oxidoreductase n=1 Tax=Rhodococcus opacus TaxID=37919 RepID=UPI001C440BA9|nr:FAD-dependent oxidoreductase [Rhodococcus opacus]MBV6755479.1 FAD-dependent oxidoreductase [Rhodococcus opacus]
MDVSASVLVVGASVASAALIAQLREDGFAGRVVVLDHDPDAPYDRPPLSKDFLGGTSVRPEAPWWDGNCELIRGQATGLDTAASAVEVALGDGSTRTLAADHIVAATGAAPIRLPGEPTGVAQLRTAADARHIREATTAGQRVIVLGAGTIGTELASTLVAGGCSVAVVDQADRPLDRFLGGHLGAEAAAWIQDGGAELHLRSRVEQIAHTATGWTVTTDSGQLTGDLVVSAVGVRPATQWLQGSGVDITDGIRCDSDGTALDPDGAVIPHVHAIGDVAAWSTPTAGPRRSEDWTTAQRHGRHLARHLLGLEPLQPVDRELRYFWSHQFGRRIQVLGTPVADATLVQHVDEPARKSAFYTLERDSATVAWISINAPKEFVLAMRKSVSVHG